MIPTRAVLATWRPAQLVSIGAKLKTLFNDNMSFGPGEKINELQLAVPEGYVELNPNWKGEAAPARPLNAWPHTATN